MSEDDREGWTAEELEGLDSLPRTIEPPAALEDRIVARLAAEGMIEPRSRRRAVSSGRRVLAAAAALAIFGAGWAAGHGGRTAPRGPRFALLLYEGSDFQSGIHAKEYAAWAGALRRSGVAVEGDELSDDSRRISSAGRIPERESSEKLAGFFIVGARDLAAAESIARTCPHLRYRGVVAVRPVAGR